MIALRVLDFVLVALLSFFINSYLAHGQTAPPPDMPTSHPSPADDPYDPGCCSFNDCQPIDYDEVEPLEGGAYYIKRWNARVEADQVRPTTPKMNAYAVKVLGHPTPYHVCAYREETKRLVIRCFYAGEARP